MSQKNSLSARLTLSIVSSINFSFFSCMRTATINSETIVIVESSPVIGSASYSLPTLIEMKLSAIFFHLSKAIAFLHTSSKLPINDADDCSMSRAKG